MNTLQLGRILKEDPYTSSWFKGVFAKDQIPQPTIPGVYMFNTDPSHKPGEHWLAVYVGWDGAEYFDSYGRPPPKGIFAKFMTKCGPSIHNPVWLQGPWTAVCGQYCLYYLLHRCRGYSMDTIVHQFGSNLEENDRFVYDYMNKHYPSLTKSI